MDDAVSIPLLRVLFNTMNQAVFWSFFVLGLFVWLVFRPYATAPWKILGVFALLLVAQPLTVIALKSSSRAHPLKYDYVLQSLDQALGFTAFQVARLFTPREDTAILFIYELMSAAMIVWYGLQLLIRGGDSRKLLYSYLILFIVGGCLYGIVPALGPRHAFGASFPMGHPNVAPVLAPLEGYPNAMPSLHVATAVLLVLFARRNRWLLFVSLLFLAATVAATLALEHYVIDLVVAVPFACFAMESAYGKLIPAGKYLTVVLVWLGLIRLMFPELIRHPWPLRLLALFSVLLGVRAVAAQWMGSKEPNAIKIESALARVDLGPSSHG